MTQVKTDNITIQELAKNLATFAIDRADTKKILSDLPKNNDLNVSSIEYEIQILKILSVGWAISFFMPVTDKKKEPVTQIFWNSIREVSNNVSTLTKTTTGQDINYFDILKERLNTYLAIMQENPEETKNPVNIIGPAFACACGNENNAIVILTGSKMFTQTLGAVKEYLNIIKIDDIKLN